MQIQCYLFDMLQITKMSAMVILPSHSQKNNVYENI